MVEVVVGEPFVCIWECIFGKGCEGAYILILYVSFWLRVRPLHCVEVGRIAS